VNETKLRCALCRRDLTELDRATFLAERKAERQREG
jgi:hypothetical protein